MQTQFQKFQSQFPDLITHTSFFTEDAETVTFIDTESNRIEFTRCITLSCGCCGDYEQFDDELDRFVDFLSESDFQDLIEHLTIKTK